MADLSYAEKRTLEKFLDMGGGYVLDFSNRTFEEFVFDTSRVNIYNDKYATRGSSKANRLRSFWEQESSAVVGRLIRALLDYVEQMEVSDEEDRGPREEVRRIADRLTSSTAPPAVRAHRPDAPDPPAEVPADYFHHLWRQGFRIQSVLGRGLSGRVFLAHQRSLERLVAIKFFDNKTSRRDRRRSPRAPEARLPAPRPRSGAEHPKRTYMLAEPPKRIAIHAIVGAGPCVQGGSGGLARRETPNTRPRSPQLPTVT